MIVFNIYPSFFPKTDQIVDISNDSQYLSTVGEKRTMQLELGFLINLKPLNIKTKLNIIKIDYICTFIKCLKDIIIIGVKNYFLRLGLGLGLGHIVVITSA